MTDRELLESAAKAAGIVDFVYLGNTEGGWSESLDDYWNPLTDDGDALRLAVKLSLLVLPYPDDHAVRVTRLDQPDTIAAFGDDPYAATRRAIVRAAAAIAQEQQK
jgi:hypothetical protein